MRIYLTPPQPSRGLQRIADALVRYKPEWVEIVETEPETDLLIIYAIGRRDSVQRLANHMLSTGRKYAVIQVALRSTMAPDPWDWMQIWEGAEAVWSYYDLDAALNEGNSDPSTKYHMPCEFYHAPLGADAEVFRDHNMPKHYVVCSSGLSRLSESVRECHLAAQQFDRFSLHLGPGMNLGRLVRCKTDLTDEQLAIQYSACEFVSGLRRKEGFELPAIEGLLCGARPLVFKSEDWKFNYGNHAIYLEEGSRQDVVDQLVEIFKRGAPPVTPEERELAVARYDWKKIVGGFYERLR